MNLIEMIKEEIDGSVLSSISQKAGVSTDQAEKGLSVAIPSILGGLLKNSGGNDENFLGGLLNISGDANLADNPDMGDDSQLLERGSALSNNLFGTDRESITNEISNSTGLDHAKSSGLLAMIVPVVTGLVSKLMTKHNWNFSDLAGRIGASKDEIFSSLPDGLRNSLGFANVRTPDRPDTPEMPDIDIPNRPTPVGDLPEVNLPPTDFPKTDTPPSERLEDEEVNINVPPAAPIPPLVDEPQIIDAPEINEASVTNEPVVNETINEPIITKSVEREPVRAETLASEPTEPERIPPRAAIPPEPTAKSKGGMLQWVLVIVLVILILWWLL